MAEESKLTIDVSQVLAALDRVDQQIASLKDDLGSINTATKEAFSSKPVDEYAKSAGAGASELDTVKRKLSDIDKQSGKIAGRKLFGADVLRDIQVAGKSIGEWENNLKDVAGKLSTAESGTKKLTLAQRALNFIIKASPIAFLIGLVASVIAYFTKFESGTRKVSQVLAGLNAAVDVVIGRFLKFGSAVLNIVSGEFEQGFNDLKDSVTGIGDELVSAATAAAALEKRMQELVDLNRTQGVQNARLKGDLEDQLRISGDQAKSYRDRIAAAKEAARIEKQLADSAVDSALEALNIAQKQFELNTENADNKNALAEADIAFTNALNDRKSALANSEARILDLRKQASEAGAEYDKKRKEQIDQEIKDLERIAAAIEKLRAATAPDGLDAELAATEKKYNDLQKIAEEGVKKLQEIESRRGLTTDEAARLQELADLQIAIEERRVSELVDVLAEYNDKEAQAREEQARRREELARKVRDGDIKALQELKAVRDSEIALQEERGNQLVLIAQKSGAKQEDVAKLQRAFQLATQKARLESELKFQQSLLDITDAGDTAQVNAIRQKIGLIQEQLKTLNIDITTPEFEAVKPKSLLELLGFDLEDVPKVEQAAQQIISTLQTVTAARIDAANAAVDATNRQVSAAEDALDQEIALAEAGFASNVTLKRQELENTKQAQKQALDEQRKAARAQLIVDSSIQASNIITSTTNLIKSWSTIPFGVGLAVAFSQIAAVIGLITSIKSKARALSSQRARYGAEGFIGRDGIIKGRMHSQGGERLEVERGEMVQVLDDGTRKRVHVVRRENAKQYSALLQAANDGDRKELAARALEMADFDTLPTSIQNRILAEHISATNPELSAYYSTGPEISRKKVSKRVVNEGQTNNINTTIQGDNKRTNEILERMLAVMLKQNSGEEWSQDGKVRKRGGVITRYSK